MEGPCRKPNRLPKYDYSGAGYYFITVCTRGKQALFWSRSVGATCGRPPLSTIGRMVEEELFCLDATYPNIRLDKYVIMPNHIHLILQICMPESGRPQVAPTISRVMKQFKGAVTKRAGFPLWQKSFHDHVVRNEPDYLRIWRYMDSNPLKREEDCYHV